MAISCGIVGLPNVGKSTLFNALTATQAAEAANFPFCTIEPNVGIVAVPDIRLDKLALIAKSQKIIPTQLEFVDIAGLVKGASKGEGLGNKFLANIREVNAIIHVLRCFEDEDVTHVSGSVDPLRDAETIELELVMADLESIEKRIGNLEKKVKAKEHLAVKQLELCNKLKPILNEGQAIRSIALNDEEKNTLKTLQLLSCKPILYVANVGEDEAQFGNKFSKKVEELAHNNNSQMIIISSKIEEEIAQLSTQEEKQEFLSAIGLQETGLNKIVTAAYHKLNLLTFFTIGPKEARAWTIKHNSTAPQAAGVIHTDFEKGFIRSETIKYKDYVEFEGESGCRENGKIRLEGKDYIMQDGDICHFRFNV